MNLESCSVQKKDILKKITELKEELNKPITNFGKSYFIELQIKTLEELL